MQRRVVSSIPHPPISPPLPPSLPFQERNVIDCCRVEFLRPVSSTPDTPSCAFDVQSIERTWTLCAANETDLQQWLLLLASAIDMDVAVLPDDEVSFLVKPR
ncbi:hypothetical protein Naga_102493g1 [Nannochloropsis gaditana]|uniref:PH domain-containing protein n=1 Tax=Nannochloropsis gaditana TaxID=72520 RepID=W7TSD8_9STRA|nr:hypothetical protein Naga_102493g1 [Nannochloropsis gaditana]